MAKEKDFLDILEIALRTELIDVNLKVNLPPGFLIKLDEATADKRINSLELADLLALYRQK